MQVNVLHPVRCTARHVPIDPGTSLPGRRATLSLMLDALWPGALFDAGCIVARGSLFTNGGGRAVSMTLKRHVWIPATEMGGQFQHAAGVAVPSWAPPCLRAATRAGFPRLVICGASVWWLIGLLSTYESVGRRSARLQDEQSVQAINRSGCHGSVGSDELLLAKDQ